MISRLSGVLLEKEAERLTVEVGGVGYDVRVSLSTLSELPDVGDPVRVLIHTHVREDSITLFGFATPLERFLFEKVISVSGVGPKIAMSLLSGLSPEELSRAIRSGATTTLSKIPGVGKKTAERLVVDLRDKLASTLGPEGVSGDNADAGKGREGGVLSDVYSALLNLGYSAREADRALEQVRHAEAREPSSSGSAESRTFEGLLKEALRNAAPMR